MCLVTHCIRCTCSLGLVISGPPGCWALMVAGRGLRVLAAVPKREQGALTLDQMPHVWSGALVSGFLLWSGPTLAETAPGSVRMRPTDRICRPYRRKRIPYFSASGVWSGAARRNMATRASAESTPCG